MTPRSSSSPPWSSKSSDCGTWLQPSPHEAGELGQRVELLELGLGLELRGCGDGSRGGRWSRCRSAAEQQAEHRPSMCLHRMSGLWAPQGVARVMLGRPNHPDSSTQTLFGSSRRSIPSSQLRLTPPVSAKTARCRRFVRGVRARPPRRPCRWRPTGSPSPRRSWRSRRLLERWERRADSHR